jgi:hypothetical protein
VLAVSQPRRRNVRGRHRTSGLFDTSSKSLGAAILDLDNDGWLDLFVANDTQPNKLYRNQKNGTFKEVAVESGVAFSTEGKARAGMGVDAAYLGNALVPTLATTNFDNEMIGLYKPGAPGGYEDVASRVGSAPRLGRRSGSVVSSLTSISMAARI